MIPDKKWFAFFSHTGSEIYNISKHVGRFPDRVITTRSPGDKISPGLIKNVKEIVYMSNKLTVSDYNRLLARCNDCICTLHGWMKIIPKSICTEYEMYNLHPGLITKYPGLKGKDPQKRVDNEQHNEIGVVIHKVTPGVDEGPVIVESSCLNSYYSDEAVTARLHDMALDTWLAFFAHYGEMEAT